MKSREKKEKNTQSKIINEKIKKERKKQQQLSSSTIQIDIVTAKLNLKSERDKMTDEDKRVRHQFNNIQSQWNSLALFVMHNA